MRLFTLRLILPFLCGLLFALPGFSDEGACCSPELVCTDNIEQVACQQAGNGFAGVGSSCSTENLCSNIYGACCTSDSCSMFKFYQCHTANGTFLGAGEQCTENACAPPPVTGACCHAGGCTLTEEASCTGEGYHWAGADTACVETSAAPQCPDQVACCSEGTCSEMSPEMCANVNGIDVGHCSDPSPTCETTATGACCVSDGCLEATAAVCQRTYGPDAYQGDGTTCDDVGICVEEQRLGACCIENMCTETTAELCHAQDGTYYGDGSQCLGDECPGAVEPILTACCLPDGQCLDLQQAECFAVNGVAMANESCVDAISASGGTMVSTGWDTTAIGNFDIGPSSPVLVPYGDAPSSLADYLQWMSVNEPSTLLGVYYFQSTMTAVQTAAANWHCAGDDGYRLRKVFNLTLQNVVDPALVGNSYNTIDAIRAALSASSDYSAVTSTSTWNDIHAVLVEVNDGSNLLYSSSGQVAQDCYVIETSDFQCPAPQACCIDGACLQLTQVQCEERGGQIVGDDCEDDDIVCEGDDPGACCVEGACVQVGIEVCEERYQGTFYSDTDQCIEECTAAIGGCCLPNGDCIDMEEYKCLTSSGVWLGDGVSCQNISTGPAAGGTIISTGWNNYLIGNLDTGYNPPVLYPLGSVVTSINDYLQWISVNEPGTNFRTYYYQSTSVAIQTAAANWHCAGDQGNKLSKTYMIKLFDVPDAALVGTTYYNFSDLRDALLGSSAYGVLNATSDWNTVFATLMDVGVATADGINDSPYGIYGQNAQDCFTVEETGFECPIPEACCVDGACFDLTADECEERGGQIVGDDCDDADIVCEPIITEGACCYQGNCVGAGPEQCEDPLQGVYYTDSAQCLAECAEPVGVCCLPNGTCQPNWDAYHCELAGGSWVVDGSCDENDAGVSICPQPDLIACCIRDGCFEMTVEECEERGGQNVGDDCDDPDISCGTPIGACCLDDGSCAVITEDKCKDILGNYQGDGTNCNDAVCAPVDAGPCGDDETGTGTSGDDPLGACCKSDVCSEKNGVGMCYRKRSLGGCGHEL